MTVYKDIKIDIPKWVSYIIDTLQENDYEVYIVGGAVRDSLLNRKVKDWDITTNAKPDNVIEIFESLGYKIIPTGLKHGTVTIVIDKEQFEVTTYRLDGEYTDNRRPDNVTFTSSLKEDLSRRDLTINAMAYSDKEGLVDYFGGLNDLEDKIIKCVGNPLSRFSEDSLRILRVYRFAAQLGFDIEENTLSATIKLKDNISNISKERIREEFNKILLSDSNILFGVFNYGILNNIIPELFVNCADVEQNNPYHIYNVFNHIIYSIVNIESQLLLKLTMLFHDVGKPVCKTTDEQGIDHFYGHAEVSANMAEKILKRLKYDNDTINKVTTLVKYHDIRINEDKQIRKLLNKIGEENVRDLLKVREADIKAQNLQYYNERHEKVLLLTEKLENIIKENNCFQLKDLTITGKDLINLGFKQGKEIGVKLNELLELVLENPELNNKEYLIEYVNRSK